MNDPIVIDPRNFNKKLQSLLDSEDAQGFVEYCKAIESTAMTMVKNHKRREASSLLNLYADVFESADWHLKSPEMVLQVLEVFPVNHYTTMRLLGISKEADDYILAHKLNIAEFDCGVESGYEDVLNWAVKTNQHEYAAQFVHEVVQRVHQVCEDVDDKAMRLIGNALVDGLVDNDPLPGEITCSIDQDIASLLNSTGDYRRSGQYIPTLAKLGMSKTLMTMMVNGMLSGISYTNEANFEPIIKCLPQEMTLAQLHAVNYHLGIPSVAEKILFDDSVNMTDFIAAMKDSRFSLFQKNDLHIEGIRPFYKHITPENFERPERRKRILQLLDAMLESGTIKYDSVEEVRKALKYQSVPQFAFKYIRCLRSIELEDAMGL
jgi:hypothetical protein